MSLLALISSSPWFLYLKFSKLVLWISLWNLFCSACRIVRTTEMLWTLSLQELAQYTKDASLQYETLDSTFVFYDNTKAQLNAYQVCTSIHPHEVVVLHPMIRVVIL